jgi:hypothetical protein
VDAVSLALCTAANKRLIHFDRIRGSDTRSSKDHDFVTVASSVVKQAVFEHLNGRPLENPDDGKNLANVGAASMKGVIRGPFPARHHIQCVSSGRRQAGPGL